MNKVNLTNMICLGCNLPFFNCICEPKKSDIFDEVIAELVKKYLKENQLDKK